MNVVLVLVSVALFVYLVAILPFQSRSRRQRLAGEIASDPEARVRFYAQAIARDWILAAIVVVLFVASGANAHGLRLIGDPAYLVIGLCFLFGVGVGALRIRRLAATPERRELLANKLRNTAIVLPHTEAERRTWVGVAFTAGITEELLYRGFVLIALLLAFGLNEFLPLVIVSGALFGWAHLYQGTKGVTLTAFVGVALAVVAIGAGLLLAMAIHVLIDLRILMVPPDVVAEAANRLEREGR